MTTRPTEKQKPAAKPKAAAPKKPRFGFMRDTVAELKKVTWLSWPDVIRLTAIVLVVAILLGAFLGALDYGFTALVDKVLVGR
jgi:preprotein translocase subunit SecE